MSRVVCLDYGEKRIGVAQSDETRTLAAALPFIVNTGSVKKAAEQLPAAGMVLVGLPRNMDGSYGEAAVKVREFSSSKRFQRLRRIMTIFTGLSGAGA